MIIYFVWYIRAHWCVKYRALDDSVSQASCSDEAHHTLMWSNRTQESRLRLVGRCLAGDLRSSHHHHPLFLSLSLSLRKGESCTVPGPTPVAHTYPLLSAVKFRQPPAASKVTRSNTEWKDESPRMHLGPTIESIILVVIASTLC